MKLKELNEKYPDKTFGQIQVTRKYKFLESGRQDFQDYLEWEVQDLGWDFSLPHQCDEWEIGSVNNAQEFLTDLTLAIHYCEENK